MIDAKIRFNSHKQSAKLRGIDFKLTFDEWNNWWLANGIDKNYPTVKGGSRPCMSRFNDTGPYSLNNIFLSTISKNMKDSNFLLKKEISKRNSRKVSTPNGVFDSKIKAATHYGIRSSSFDYWMKREPNKYFYID